MNSFDILMSGSGFFSLCVFVILVWRCGSRGSVLVCDEEWLWKVGVDERLLDVCVWSESGGCFAKR